MRKLVLPTWTQHMSDMQTLDAKEMIKIYGYSEASNITKLVKSDSVPKPDGKSVRGNGRVPKLAWSLGYLRQLEVKQNG
jgi:hypothetical protein